jgi:hypothetical protein
MDEQERRLEGERIAAALSEPFPAHVVKFKPQVMNKERTSAMATTYIDARIVMDRLDEVVGPFGWKTEYSELSGGVVLCRLSLRVQGEWVQKEDVGAESDQKDAQDRRKAAVSDAFKRAAVHWGVGRYLYSVKAGWFAYDSNKNAWVQQPQLPAWALPGGGGHPPAPAQRQAQQTQKPAVQGQQAPRVGVQGQQQALPPAPNGKQPLTQKEIGEQFLSRLRDADKQLVEAKMCRPGELISYIAKAGAEAGFPADMTLWDKDMIALARSVRQLFEVEKKAKKPAAAPAADRHAAAVRDAAEPVAPPPHDEEGNPY